MKTLIKLAQDLSNIPSGDWAVVAQEGAKVVYNGGKKLGGHISDFINAIFD